MRPHPPRSALARLSVTLFLLAVAAVTRAQPRMPDLVLSPVPGQPAQMQLTFSPVVPDWSYAVQVSTDLRTWTPLTGATQSDLAGVRTITDSAASAARRFYRVAGPSLEAFRNPHPTRVFYINATTGSDLATGTSPTTAWRSLDKARQKGLKAGDVVRLARGSVWTGENLYFGSGLIGTAAAPIVFEAYGDGEPPTIRDPRAPWEDGTTGIHPPFDAVYLEGASAYVNVLDLRIQDSDPSLSGVSTGWSSHHIVIAGVEVANVGRGMMIRGSDQRVIGCTIRDLVAPTAAAEGINFYGTRQEFAWNRFVNCHSVRTAEEDDGNAFEFFDPSRTARDIRIHHNVIDRCYGFMELDGAIDGLLIAYNLYINSPNEALEFHLDDSVRVGVVDSYKNTRIENNTFAPITNAHLNGWGIIGLLSAQGAGDPPIVPANHSISVRNNIFVTAYRVTTNNLLGASFTHDHNLIRLVGAGQRGDWPLGAGEVAADPKFVDAVRGDYRLAPGSPARNAGVAASAAYDLRGTFVPTGAAPDLGAYETK